jgi:predicted DNA-binding transcriptional regulator YafY
MRSSRLLALLLHLQVRGRATADELAALSEVSVRTIYRDIAALQAAGIPLWTETGPRGGVRLLDGWQSQIAGLTADEAGLIALAGVPGAAADLGLGPALAAAEVKLTAGLAPAQRDRAAEVRARFLLDAPGWYEPPEVVPHLPVLARATFSGHRLDVRYRAGRGGSTFRRRIDPLGLVLKGGAWYLVAGHGGATVRSYRVGRVVEADVVDEPVARPDGFDLADWWRASMEAFDDVLFRFGVELRVSEFGLRGLPHAVPGAPARDAVAAARAAGSDAEGWYLVNLRMESEDVALHQLTGLGADVEVLAPVTLRKRLAEVGEAMVRRNRSAMR